VVGRHRQPSGRLRVIRLGFRVTFRHWPSRDLQALSLVLKARWEGFPTRTSIPISLPSASRSRMILPAASSASTRRSILGVGR